MIIAFRTILLFAFLLTTGLVQAEPKSALAWLELMSRQMQKSSYEGTFIYLHDGEMEMMNIAHGYDENGEIERLVSLNGVPREIVRDSANVICVWPDSKVAVVSSSRQRSPFPIFSAKALTQLGKQYRFVVGKTDRIANKKVQLIEIISRDDFRFGYNIWVDESNYLLMRSDLVGKNGKAVEQVIFTRMEPVERVEIEQVTQGSLSDDYHWSHNEDKSATGSVSMPQWRFTSLPAGFEKVTEQIKSIYRQGTKVSHITLSDGLASISVYIDPNYNGEPSASALQEEVSMGAVNAYGEIKDSLQVTAIGEVPMETIKYIVSALEVER